MRVSALLVVACAVVGAFSSAAAQQAPAAPAQPEVLARMYACADVAEGAARLACYDSAVGALKKAQTEGEFAAVDAAGVRRIEREAFGFSLPSLPRLGLPGFARSASGEKVAPAPTNEVEMTIERTGFSDGKPTFIMSNGQVWAHIDDNKNRRARPGATVTIRRAALGSYLMGFDGGAALRVRRIE